MQTVNHSKNIVETNGVSFSYGGNEVLKDITLNIHKGDYLGIVGGNGAGKTTLLKIMLGLLAPTTGSVKLFGQDIREFKEWYRIGYVPQKATSFDVGFPATVQEVVAMGRFGRRGLFHRITEDDRKKTRQALEYVEMWRLHDRLIGNLSGGEQQRVFIARALAAEPEIVLLDEPTVGVAEEIKKDFYALLRKLNQELDLTVVLVTHDIESVAHEAMHVACIDCTVFFHESVDGFLESTQVVEHPHHSKNQTT